jgi:hypothetical protein
MRSDRSFLLVASLLASLLIAGCSSASSGGDSTNHPDANIPDEDASCGVGPIPGQDAGPAYVSEDGTVTFEPTAVGTSAQFQVAVKDSADVAETITGASLAGYDPDAFRVTSSFPIDVPAGGSALVGVEFVPPSAGTFSAQLVLQTMKMGPSPVALEGAGN